MESNGYDYDIPVAVATPDFVTDQRYATATIEPQQTLSKGRSSRVLIPEDSSNGNPLSDDQIQSLRAQGFTIGLIAALHRNNQTFPMRIWVVDNSGSMSAADGHRIVDSLSADTVKLVKCSRWSELQQTVAYHAQMASLMKAPTVFRLLNDPGRTVGPRQFSIAERSDSLIHDDLQIALHTITHASPSGCTPLSQHVIEIRENIVAMLPQLESKGQRVAIVLATDGLPTDTRGNCSSTTRAEFENSLRSLAGLPVWLIVRLCTDEDSVVEYYNSLDSQLELSLEVLDDWTGESKEVHEFNPWLNYGLCLHRMREMGFYHRVFDLLDERRLTLDELKEFLFLLFGPDDFDGAPDPNTEFNAFLHFVKVAVQKAGKTWNPLTNKMSHWIDINILKKCFRDSCCIM